MKRTIFSSTLAFLFLLCHSISFAALNQMTGNWKNTDPNTRGITTLVIDGNANNLSMHAWGKCHPQDLGEVEAAQTEDERPETATHEEAAAYRSREDGGRLPPVRWRSRPPVAG